MGLLDKFRNKKEKVTGGAKEKLGDATDDREMQAEGKYDQAKADFKDAGEHVKDAADDAKDAFKR